MKNVSKLYWLWVFGVVLLFTTAGRSFGEDGYVSLLPTDDAYVNSGSPGTNYGSSTNLYVGDRQAAGGGTCYSYLKFSLSTIPAGATIIHAELWLNLHETYPSYQQKKVGVHTALSTAWTEGTIKWNNQPGFAPAATSSITSNFNPGWYCWDVTAALGGGGGSGAYSATVVMQPKEYAWNNFYSKEWPAMPDKRPRLEVVYRLAGTVIPAGKEEYLTETGQVVFGGGGGGGGLPPILPGFFGPGSDPFAGDVSLRGHVSDPEAGCGDSICARKTGVYLNPTGTVATEIVALSLVSTSPIRVTYGGVTESFFDVFVDLILPSPGSMTITKTSSGGGVYTYMPTPLSLRFRFVKRGSGEERTLDIPGPQYPGHISVAGDGSWQQEATKEARLCGYDGFYAKEEEELAAKLAYGLPEPGPCGNLTWMPPQEVLPQFCVTTESQWLEALDRERVRPATVSELEEFRVQFNAFVEQGLPPYPTSAQFVQSELYVCGPEGGGGGGGGACSCDDKDAGLVMYWGEGMADGEYAAAFVWEYPADPDLTNCVVTTTVYPPCWMLVVSLGLADANGNIRAWYWNVAPLGALPPYPPGTIPCSPVPGPWGPGAVPTTITIDLSQTGVGAATPVAASYSNNPAFDITNVTDFKFDEDNIFNAWAQVPTPGLGILASWNYWKDILVVKKTPPAAVHDKYYIKWSQRPALIDANDPKIIKGWDERSMYYWRPMVADDWLCEDDRPVTDIHWWGSFLGWNQPYPPPVAPKTFHIGIWTDVPVGADPMADFSHPGMLIWQNYCDNWVWNFYGYDEDPRMEFKMESCFQFNQLLSEDEWFYQDPNELWPWGENPADPYPNGTVYWLSIAAVYDPNVTTIPYPWGWKTREPHWNDDAVRIWDTVMPPVDYPPGFPPANWPPSIGAAWVRGDPIEWPVGEVSWDVCFELTTNEAPHALSADLNTDGIVDLRDLAILANQWLTAGAP